MDGNQGPVGNILVVADQKDVREQLQQVVTSYENVQYTTSTEVKTEIDRIAPDVVLLFEPRDQSGVDLVQSIHSAASTANIVFISDREDFELLRDVMRAGALEFFVIPAEIGLLAQRIGKIVEMTHAQKTNETAATEQTFRRGRGRVYSFYSGKGGCGRTLLSTSFAQTLKLESTAEVIMVDLNLQFGGAEAYLGIESNRSLAELGPVIDELNESHIQNVTEREAHSSLELLLSPRDVESAEGITDDFVTKLIRACRRNYDFVIIDLPTVIDENTYVALEESDLIYYVINADTPSLQVFKNVEALFQRLNIETEKRLELVVNQSGRDNELKSSDLKSFVRHPLAVEIRRDLKGIQALINHGQPLRKEQNEKRLTPVAKDVRKWVQSII